MAIQDGCTWVLMGMSDEKLQQVLSQLTTVAEVDTELRQRIITRVALTENDPRLFVYQGEIAEELLSLMCSVEADYAANAEWTRATKRFSLKRWFLRVVLRKS